MYKIQCKKSSTSVMQKITHHACFFFFFYASLKTCKSAGQFGVGLQGTKRYKDKVLNTKKNSVILRWCFLEITKNFAIDL